VRPRSERNRGLVFTMTGVAILVAALLYGLTKTSNGETVADWVSIITAIGGLIVGGVGLYMTSHERGSGTGPTGRTPHAPS
jgi:formate hydrogenlyase subunit 3/multisubunit Na+/H+ antiporter MnhD subunit